jgi:hypothetical protein
MSSFDSDSEGKEKSPPTKKLKEIREEAKRQQENEKSLDKTEKIGKSLRSVSFLVIVEKGISWE